MLCLMAAQGLYADGLDRLTFGSRGKEIGRWMEGGLPVKLHSMAYGDTLNFHLWTDWGGEFGAYLIVEDENGVVIDSINSLSDDGGLRPYTGYWVLNAATLKKDRGHYCHTLTFILHYRRETKLKPVPVATLSLP